MKRIKLRIETDGNARMLSLPEIAQYQKERIEELEGAGMAHLAKNEWVEAALLFIQKDLATQVRDLIFEIGDPYSEDELRLLRSDLVLLNRKIQAAQEDPPNLVALVEGKARMEEWLSFGQRLINAEVCSD